MLTYLRAYVLTYLPTYLLTYLPTYLLTYLPTHDLTGGGPLRGGTRVTIIGEGLDGFGKTLDEISQMLMQAGPHIHMHICIHM